LPDYAAHFRLLDDGGELVTATRRQAHELARAYTARQVAAGRVVWDTPRIVPWPAWTARAWQSLARETPGAAALLDPVAATRAWEHVVAESAAGRELLDARAAGRGAAYAWSKAQEWCLDVDALAPATAEQAAFLAWSRAWTERCRAHAWLDPARLTHALTQKAAALVHADGRTGARGALGFHGFDVVAPARRRFMDALERAGRATHELAVDVPAERVVVHAADGPDAELEAIAAWIVARLRADPAARLAVIVPDLAQRRATVRRVMDDRLQPSRLAPGARDVDVYAFAAGPALRDYGLVDAALLQLGLARERIDLVHAGRLLRSPYPRGADAEASRRAALDAHLRRAGELAPTVERVRLAASEDRHGCPAFAETLATVRRELEGASRRSTAQWAAAFERALIAAGWHDGRKLSSAEHQTAIKFHETLATFGALERVVGPLTLDEALDELESLVGEASFQPEAGDPQVLFLDSLTEPGLALDGLWVAGLTADRFPAAAGPDPFLPTALQRDARLPHASAELELEQARHTLERWTRSARELVLSWPVRDDDGERMPSPLLPETAARFEAAGRVPARAAQVRAAARLVPWTDRPLPALAHGEPLRGGVAVLASQSACPFQAAASHRLGVRPLERPRFGLDPRRRGTLAHEALAAFWRDVDSQERLRALPPDALATHVRTAIDEACRALPRDLQRSRMLRLERRWLERAMLALAAKELERAPFTVVEREAEYALTLGRRRIDVRIDRIDRLSDGATVLIDYKTGQGRLAPARWTGDRPDQPQLPTYAAHLPETPVAVAFGRLALAAVGYAGLSARSGVAPGVKTPDEYRHDALRGRPWDSLIDEWRRVTTALAEDYARGVADVDPTDEACRYCAFTGFCRIEQFGSDADAADGDADGD
jgi:ATP-dependent helicase/nuclease subunit B